MLTNEIFDYEDILYLVFFPLSVSDDPSIVSFAAVVLQCEGDPDAGDQDDQHWSNEPQHEEEDGVVQVLPALPLRGAAHPGGLRCEVAPAKEGRQGHGQSEAGHCQDSAAQREVGGEPLLLGREADHDVAVD